MRAARAPQTASTPRTHAPCMKALQSNNVRVKMMNFAFKTRNCVSKTRNFAFKNDEFAQRCSRGVKLRWGGASVLTYAAA